MTTQQPAVNDADLYSVVIYQNIPYVEGLYQQLNNGGKPTEAVIHQNDKEEKNLTGKAHAAGTILAIVDIGGDVEGSKTWGSDQGKSQTMTFDQAYLLHGVRTQLRSKELVTVVESGADYQRVQPGDFVEYTATFEPNLLASILDVLTPEIVAKIVHTQTARKAQGLPEGAERQTHLDKASLDASMGAAVFEAAQREFRNDSSLEFYGKVIGEGNLTVTAVTICDKSMFSHQDTDRILDGQFRVLGKVIRQLPNGYSMLDRNKLLSRLTPGAISELQSKVSGNDTVGQYVDTTLGLVSTDPALKVIPIAIFV